jgi:raffinose/stachyose/melibiose transport system permease protein
MRPIRILVRSGQQLLLVLWTVLAIAPFVLIMLLGFRDNTGIYANPFGIGGTYHPENFASAWAGPVGSVGLGQMLLNSLTTFVVAAVVNILLGTFGAYFSRRLPQRLQAAYLGVFLVGTVVPFVLLVIPFFRILNSIGLLSSPPALGVLYGILAMPTTVLVLTSYFASFPVELNEAASLDGLGELATFVRIVVPLSTGAIATVLLLLAVWVWSETQLAIVLLQTSDSQTAAVGILGFKGQFSSALGPLFAGLTILAIPIVVLYLVFHRYVSKGIALGGVFR